MSEALRHRLEADINNLGSKFNPTNYTVSVTDGDSWELEDGRSVPACEVTLVWSGPLNLTFRRELSKLIRTPPYETVDDDAQPSWCSWTVINHLPEEALEN